MTYLRNCWYMAAWSDEVGDKGLARTLLDQPVFLFRDGEGTPKALFDRCPHRFAPLSIGDVAQGVVTCRYHGLAFDGSGGCVRNPHGPVTRALATTAFPVIEAHRAIWIWMGDPALADPAALRDLSFLSQAPDTAFNKGYIAATGHYQLFIDNILDLSHTDYLHPDTLGGGSITRTRAKVEQREDGIIAIHWDSYDDIPPPLVRGKLPPGVERADSWTHVEWSAPGIMKLINGVVPAGNPREGSGTSTNVHIMTPETARTTHYFFASTRDYAVDDAQLNAAIGEIRNRIFSTEDEPMIAAQQARMGEADFWSLKPALLRIDEGAVAVRRRLEALIAAENA
ncbi:aromatic ring-hydroxylating dioxygenase subunit alpha [Novosphingobium sp.]|uniref:aromatic ring-hydroxylating dioxygenase subunit alpha n=1 Tax=Novosphingobium sp. TaxID=1874826 RepID=UPI0031D5D0B1